MENAAKHEAMKRLFREIPEMSEIMDEMNDYATERGLSRDGMAVIDFLPLCLDLMRRDIRVLKKFFNGGRRN